MRPGRRLGVPAKSRISWGGRWPGERGPHEVGMQPAAGAPEVRSGFSAAPLEPGPARSIAQSRRPADVRGPHHRAIPRGRPAVWPPSPMGSHRVILFSDPPPPTCTRWALWPPSRCPQSIQGVTVTGAHERVSPASPRDGSRRARDRWPTSARMPNASAVWGGCRKPPPVSRVAADSAWSTGPDGPAYVPGRPYMCLPGRWAARP